MQRRGQLNYSLGEITAIRELFLSLAKGIKASRQYPPEHPVSTQFKAVFFDKLKSFFEEGELIAVSVHYDTLTAQEEVVFRGSAGSDNIAHLLHRDGVRYLEIFRQITASEATELFDAFLACAERSEQCEDIVNLFWQADFEHIKYEVVDVFELGEIRELIAGYAPETKSSPVRPESALLTELVDESVTLDRSARLIPDQVSEAYQQMLDQLGDGASYSHEELAALEQLVENDRQLSIKDEVIELLLQLCRSDWTSRDLALAVEALQSTFDKTIQDADFDASSVMFNRVRELLREGEVQSPTARKKLTEFVARCGDKIRIKMLTAVLNRCEELDLEPARRYLSELGWESLHHLLWMLGELSFYPARKIMCELLVEKGLDRIDLLGSAVFDSRWYLVRNVVWVLGETGDDRAIGFLRKAAGHPEIRVRAEVVKALAKLDNEAVVDLQLSMLRDQSEKIRSMVANELGHGRRRGAFAGLQEIATSKEFPDAPLSEMRQIMEAMVTCGGAEAVEVVQKIVRRSTLFDKTRLHRLQEVAVNALQLSEDDQALTLLEKIASDSKSHVCQIARKVLSQLQFKRESKVGIQS